MSADIRIEETGKERCDSNHILEIFKKEVGIEVNESVFQNRYYLVLSPSVDDSGHCFACETRHIGDVLMGQFDTYRNAP